MIAALLQKEINLQRDIVQKLVTIFFGACTKVKFVYRNSAPELCFGTSIT